MTALERFRGHASLSEAMDFYLEYNHPQSGSCILSDLLEQYLEAKRKANRRERTLQDIRSRLGRFQAEYGDTPVHEITTPMIEG